MSIKLLKFLKPTSYENNVIIKSKIDLNLQGKLEIGDTCCIASDVCNDNLEQITTENDCCISQGPFIVTVNHDFKNQTFDYFRKKIKNETHSWNGVESIFYLCATVKRDTFTRIGLIIK